MQQFERDAIESRTNNFVALQWLERGKPSQHLAIKTASGSSGCRSDTTEAETQKNLQKLLYFISDVIAEKYCSVHRSLPHNGFVPTLASLAVIHLRLSTCATRCQS